VVGDVPEIGEQGRHPTLGSSGRLTAPLSLEHGEVSPWTLASEPEPGTGDRSPRQVLPGTRSAEVGERIGDRPNQPNRRVRDPYARWCGRRGSVRVPPIPIRR
jgi:hypothetical protein